MNLRILAVAGATVIALAGCTDGGSRAQQSATPAVDGHATALELAKCFRDNGYPNFPDPVQDEDGTWGFPESADMPREVPAACAELARNVKRYQKSWHVPSPEEMAKRREYAKCMREHGVPDFPDPDEDGNFPLPQSLRQRENDPTLRAAENVCKKYLPPGPPKPSRAPGGGR